MKDRDIKILINRYYKGELSEDEEILLKDFVRNNNDDEYADVKEHFEIMNTIFENEEKLDESFDSKILDIIKSEVPVVQKRYNINRIISGIAATALVLVSLWITMNIIGSKEVYGTVNDPITAFAETKKALNKVSKNVNKGVTPATKTIHKVETGIDKTKDIKKAKEALDKIKKLNTLNNTGELLKSLTKVTVKYGKS